MKITGLILSAGLSGRMKTFKPIINLNNKPLIVLITEKLLNICDNVVVVTGHKKEIVENTIAEYFNIKSNQLRTVFNNEYESGMFSSLKKGLSAVLDPIG
jgi:CTP:molybdopterin cytidylyltransferase MocA